MSRVLKKRLPGIDIMIPSYYDAPDLSEGSLPMRGDDRQTGCMVRCVSPQEREPADHRVRVIRRLTGAIFDWLSPPFDPRYSTMGRSSKPPEEVASRAGSVGAPGRS
jgi:hypothetical protein